MLLLPEPVTPGDFEHVLEAAAAGSLTSGPWDEALDAALEQYAAAPTLEHERTARAELARWVTDWNESLPA
ncbi:MULTISPECIES: hypothetical protein [unclassified Leucobacter]|uniref:hypothetical protein n=1 Tax=unclassified Leucobacter TaxID=2621730 RepID=UPI0006225734|nr:hypothetical protein [Leucobacter sp. Ag1]KKI18720.1 hypothetical protein XM48_10585 [Leucobacter sp. Ag1]